MFETANPSPVTAAASMQPKRHAASAGAAPQNRKLYTHPTPHVA